MYDRLVAATRVCDGDLLQLEYVCGIDSLLQRGRIEGDKAAHGS